VITSGKEATINLDGRGPELFDHGVEVIPGDHEISGTVYTHTNRVCGPMIRRCAPVTVYVRTHRGSVPRVEYRCNCWQDCEEDEYRAICAYPITLKAGETRVFNVRVYDLPGEVPKLGMAISEGGAEQTIACEETQYGGKRSSRRNSVCSPW